MVSVNQGPHHVAQRMHRILFPATKTILCRFTFYLEKNELSGRICFMLHTMVGLVVSSHLSMPQWRLDD